MDDETVATIIRVQLEDLHSLTSKRKGKAIEGSALRDEDLTINLQIAELQKLQTYLADLRMTRSISYAVQDDGGTIVVLAAEERRSAQDREIACRLSDQPTSSIIEIPDCRVEDEVLSRFGSLNIGYDNDTASYLNESVVSFSDIDSEDVHNGESSNWAAGRRTVQQKTYRVCVACAELRSVLQAPCQHRYCDGCTVRLFGDAITDETLYPVRCCGQNIPLSLARPFLGPELTVQFELKSIEFGTQDRTYCAKVSCGQFINPDWINGYTATCLVCNQLTCILCKRYSHSGDCLRDDETNKMLELARAAGWQRCFKCAAIIELEHGCNHITWVNCLKWLIAQCWCYFTSSCRCRAQFCYLCGEVWKTCKCVRFDEARLLERANVIVDRPVAPEHLALMPPREERVQQLVSELRDRHECDHRGRWRCVQGSHRCEECHNTLPKFILECHQCMLRACRRCKDNRFWVASQSGMEWDREFLNGMRFKIFPVGSARSSKLRTSKSLGHRLHRVRGMSIRYLWIRDKSISSQVSIYFIYRAHISSSQVKKIQRIV